jgi:hypothetical protein
MTDLEEHADMIEGLSADIADLCRVVQGLLMHPGMADLYGLAIPEARMHEQTIRSTTRRLAYIRAQDGRPLTIPRAQERRMLGQCYHFATLLCALLRHQRVPARVRGGFAIYLAGPDFYYNHWICERWDQAAQRWALVDPQLDDTQRAGLRIDIDPYDMPRSQFLTVDYVWQQCRAGGLNPRHYGFDEIRGMEYIGYQLLCDLAALNKTEVMAVDRWGLGLKSEQERSAEDLELLDRIAALALAGNSAVAELRACYESDDRLRVPDTIR